MTTTSALSADRLLDPGSHATGEVHDVWRWMRDHDPVHWHEPGDLPGFWSVTRYEHVKAVYRDPMTFSSAQGVLLRRSDQGEDPGAGLTLALTDPPRHKDLRRILADRFNERCARSLEAEIRADIRSTLRDAIDAGSCDFAQDVGARLSIHIVCLLLGVPTADHETLLRWAHEAFDSGKALTSHLGIMRYFIDLMYARMNEPADDAMSLLVTGVAGPDDDLLTETEILLNCENLVGAAENAGLSMTAGLLAFLEHPDQWERVKNDRGLLPQAVEEVLRWTSSATHSMRVVTRAVDIVGHRIEAGDRVVVWIPSANRDVAEFADPFRFDVTRSPNRHLALGSGEHVCIGGTMARHQMRILFSELFETVERVEQTGPVERLRSLAVSGPARFPVRLVPHR